VTGWTCQAPAKVNLFLHVGPPRADGRHPLDSLVVFADVADRLTLTVEPGLRIAGPYGAALLRDLGDGDWPMTRAAAALLAQAKRPVPAPGFVLEKNLPVAAGIGGGTADTAAIMRLTNAAYHLGFSDAELGDFATAWGYGGDAPACIACAPVLMRDDGARLEPAPPLPDLHAVLVNPNQPCSTAAVYRGFDALGLGAGFSETAPPTGPGLIGALSGYRNDLEVAALQVQPAIAEVLAALRAASETRLARISGSGATCFAVTETAAAAATLAARLSRAQPDWWVKPARLGAVDAKPQPL
jgi:4-diphosphocytidyl-2-C-methyl-D-erythritol kinase